MRKQSAVVLDPRALTRDLLKDHQGTTAGLLASLDLAGAVVTFDALHTVRANLDWLAAEKNGQYIAVVKANQPLLYARVKALP